MSFDWEVKKLGDILTLQRGHDLPSQERKFGKVPIMGSSGITGYHDQYKAKGPGVIVGRSGNSMGQVSYISENYWPLNTSLYVIDFKGNCPEFIYYLLKQIDFDKFNSGSAQKSLNRNAVYPFEIKFPPSYEIQSAIAHLLFSLENKIELNQKINQTLEQMAQALFKNWFVDFEPVKAKVSLLEAGGSQEGATLAAMMAISGKDSDALVVFKREHPEQYIELRATAELFPHAMQESELGDIPEGWYLDSIYEVANIIYGAPFKSKEFHNIKNEGLPLVRIRDLKDESPGVRTNEIHPKGYMLNDGDLIVGMDGEFKPYIWGGSSAWMNQRVCLFKPKKEIDEIFILNAIQPHLRYFELTATATTVIHLGKGNIDKFTYMRSSDALMKKYSTFSESIKQLLLNNKQENRVLIQLRDTLLPKLLSGEVTLPEAKQAISEVESVQS